MTHSILISVKKKNRLYKQFFTKKFLESKQKYLTYKNNLTSILRYAENFLYRDRFESKKGNARDTLRLINDVLQDIVSINKNYSVSEIVTGGKVVSDPIEIATKSNSFFLN